MHGNRFTEKLDGGCSRRGLLKAGAAGAALLAMPAIVRRQALASSGEINVFAWGDYNSAFLDGGLFAAFEKATGIKVNHSTYGSNEECENKLRAAGGSGFDIIFPSVDTGPNYYPDALLQPIDEAKLKVDAITQSIYRKSITLGATHRGKRYLVPWDWGTEGITWDSAAHPDVAYGNLSYEHLWRSGLNGQVACRQKSVLVSLALYLDAIGEVKTERAMGLYKPEDESRPVWEACLAYATERKKNVGAFWNNGTEATSAFTDSGCTIGQTWDNTGTDLHIKVDQKWRYSMPKEGGLGWMDTMAVPVGAANVEQAYAFMNFVYGPENGGIFSNKTGYNSAAAGSSEYLDDAKKASFKMSYPDDAAIDNLWWWPIQTAAFAKLRGEYVEKFTNA
jgi:spermidine/putrescine transport system substrate-binding protein